MATVGVKCLLLLILAVSFRWVYSEAAWPGTVPRRWLNSADMATIAITVMATASSTINPMVTRFVWSCDFSSLDPIQYIQQQPCYSESLYSSSSYAVVLAWDILGPFQLLLTSSFIFIVFLLQFLYSLATLLTSSLPLQPKLFLYKPAKS